MGIVASIGMIVAYASVCAFFTMLIAGMWYGVVRYIRENSSMLFSSNYSKKEKTFRVVYFGIMISVILGFTATNLVFWANTPNVFRDLRGHNNCTCPE